MVERRLVVEYINDFSGPIRQRLKIKIPTPPKNVTPPPEPKPNKDQNVPGIFNYSREINASRDNDTLLKNGTPTPTKKL